MYKNLMIIILSTGVLFSKYHIHYELDLQHTKNRIVNMKNNIFSNQSAYVTFLIGAEDVNDIEMDIIVKNKKIIIDKNNSFTNKISSTELLRQHTTSDGHTFFYYISKKMLMRGAGVFQLTILPYYKYGQEILLYLSLIHI